MKTHCRCRSCQVRRVLPKHPDEYLKQPKCRNCGARNYRPDRWMNERNNRKHTCNCDGYHFPHRSGSIGCKFDKHGEYKNYEVV